MVKKRSQEKEISEAIRLGQENLTIYPKVKNWCRHLDVNMVSAGMLAQMTHLPIGRTEIICEHTTSANFQAMQLYQVATNFILNNCHNCSFHEATDIDNIGALIFKEADHLAEEKKAVSISPEIDRTEKSKQELRRLISGDIHQALAQSEITEQSILKLVALLDNNTNHAEAALKLERASEVAPELFNGLAIEIICSNFPHPEHGAYAIRAVRNLIRLGKEPPQMAVVAAENCLSENQNGDEICAIIGDLIAHCGYNPRSDIVDRIIGVQSHGHIIGLSVPYHRGYSGSNYALKEIGIRWPEILIDLLRKRILTNDISTRINAAHVLVSLIDDVSGLGISLIDSLINSLELDDDLYEDSADATACQAIAAIYIRDPIISQERIEQGYKRCSAEAKEVLYNSYRFIAIGHDILSIEGKNHIDQYQACIPVILPHLLQVIGGLNYSLEVKRNATEALSAITHHNPEILIPNLEKILTTLALIIQEEVLLSEKRTDEGLDSLEKQSQQATFGSIIRDVTNSLIAASDLNPRLVLSKIKSLVLGLISINKEQALLKAELARVYGHLGTKSDLLPEIVPELFKLLLDMDSVIVRGTAVQSIGEILKNGINTLPDNMLDIVVVYLNDPYVYVHKNATRVVSSMHGLTYEKTVEIMNRLLILDQAYQSDFNFRQKVLRAFIHITYKFPDLLSSLTVTLILKNIHVENANHAEDALMEFSKILNLLPKQYETIFGNEVIDYLGRSNRDRYNNEFFSNRYHLYSFLFDLPRQVISQKIDGIKSSAMKHAKDDPWDSLKFVTLLNHFEFFDEGSDLASAIASQQSKTKRYEGIVKECVVVGSLASAEEQIIQGKPEKAIEILEGAAQIEEENDAENKENRFEDITDSFEVAERVARQLRIIQGLRPPSKP